MTSAFRIPGLDDSTGLETRTPALDLGRQIVRIERLAYHQSETGGDPGCRVDVSMPDGSVRGWRINYSSNVKSRKFGPIETKRLFVAAKGLSFDDPKASAFSADEISAALGPSQPLRGAWIEVEAVDGTKINEKSGKPYRNVRVLGPASAPAGYTSRAVDLEPLDALGAPASPPPPPPPPPAPSATPAAVQGPPPGWFAFPAGDPRGSTHYYNSVGELRAI